MGMAASQARFLSLTARKTNVEYEGQQINQHRTTLSNESSNYYSQLCNLVVPTPPSSEDFTKTVYSFVDGSETNTINSIIAQKEGIYLLNYTQSYETENVVANGAVVTTRMATDSGYEYYVGANKLRTMVARPDIKEMTDEQIKEIQENDAYLNGIETAEARKVLTLENQYLSMLQEKYSAGTQTDWFVKYQKNSTTGSYEPVFYNKEQVEAILAMKLSSLCRLDGIKLNNELEEKRRFIDDCRYLLSEPTALDQKLIETLESVSQRFGDERRTKVTNVLGEEEEPEQIIEKDIAILRYDNTLKIAELPLKKAVKPQEVYYTTTLGTLTLVTDRGKIYTASVSKLKTGKEYKISEVFDIGGEHPRLLIDTMSFNAYKSLTCITKQGYIKKSHINEYIARSKKGTTAIKLEEGDSIVTALLSSDDDDKIAVISNNNYYNCYSLNEISYTGRNTKGVKAIKLEKDGFIKEAKWVGNNTYVVTGRAVKGVKYG